VGDEGGKVGPDLTRAGFDYKPEWLFAWVQNPQNMKKKTKMPNLGLRTEEAIAITAFLSTLKGEVSKIPEEWGPYMETAGDPKRGEALFYDPDGKANCVKCHWILGKGGKVGANLSMVGSSRTLPFLLESILDPTAVITVGFSSMMVLTKEKKFITGIKKGEDDSSLTIFTKEGKLITIPKERIKKFKVQKLSMMPGNYKDILTVREIQDLLAYLNTLQPPILKNLGSPELDSEEEEERAIDIQLLRK
jgi:putative heme-binding domain-containing protein